MDLVFYGTFSEISEKLINEKGDIREIVGEQFGHSFLNIKKKDKSLINSIGQVLLVDEVDTFFSKDFYGNTYNPCKFIANP